MKRLIILLCVSCWAVLLQAQQYLVYSVTGHVDVEENGKKREVKLREKLTPQNVLVLAYKAQIVLLDEAAGKQYTLQQPGRAVLKSMLSDRHTTVMTLTAQYLAYMKARLKGRGELTAHRHSDPATVTREVAGMKKDEFEVEFDDFEREAWKEYDEFRSQANKEYAEFVEKAWKWYGAKPPIPKPKEKEVPPVVMPKEDRMKAIDGVPVKIDGQVLRLPTIKPQPVPVVPIHEQEEGKGNDEEEEKVEEEVEDNTGVSYAEFTFYGTPLRIRYTEKEELTLKDSSPRAVASAWKLLSKADFDNTIFDCLALRSRHQLSDWAYLMMLDSMSVACHGKSNEATLLMSYLFCQSGYKMRMGVSDGRLCLLYASKHHIYSQPYYEIDDEHFFIYGSQIEHLNICEASYPKEQPLSLLIPQSQVLAESPSKVRLLKSDAFPEMIVRTTVNQNLIKFCNDYPSSMLDNNFMTRWAMYANMPFEASVRENLLPALKKYIEGKSQKESVERLLNWVQTAFVYEYDDKVWGGDRAFFAEETLYYPYCDCEDRSILLSRLVRDLLGLKVILVYYPGHLAMAVHFTEDVKGDYIELNKEHYVVCDPTYIGAPVGRTMPRMNNQTATVILLEQ